MRFRSRFMPRLPSLIAHMPASTLASTKPTARIVSRDSGPNRRSIYLYSVRHPQLWLGRSLQHKHHSQTRSVVLEQPLQATKRVRAFRQFLAHHLQTMSQKNQRPNQKRLFQPFVGSSPILLRRALTTITASVGWMTLAIFVPVVITISRGGTPKAP